MFEGRKEYIYLVQSEIPHKLYNYYHKHPDVVYLAFTLGIVCAGLLREPRFYALCYEILDLGLVKRFWTATPGFHRVSGHP
jgi:hypothetical protein